MKGSSEAHASEIHVVPRKVYFAIAAALMVLLVLTYAVAQVDLGHRVHRHQSTQALGRMSGQIMLTLFDRLERYDRLVNQSSYVWIDGIHIHNRVNGNNDGFHFVSAEYVHISNCDV